MRVRRDIFLGHQKRVFGVTGGPSLWTRGERRWVRWCFGIRWEGEGEMKNEEEGFFL